MKICYIAHPDSTHTRRWVNWFAQHGHDICVISDTPQLLDWPNVKVYDFASRHNHPETRFIFWSYWLRSLVRQWKPDIIHSHRVTVAGWLGLLSGFHPFVVTPWGSDLYQLPNKSPFLRWMGKQVLSHADLVTTDSQDLRKQAIQYGANPKKTQLVQWGVDLTIFHPDIPLFDIKLQTIRNKRPVILSPRAVKPIYNLDILIQAIPLVLGEYPDALFILRDYNPEPDYKNRLTNQISHLGIKDSILWIAEIEPWERIAGLYRLADLVVSIPSSDGTPVSVLEAMACGIPIIATDLPSLREWITPEVNGCLVPVRNPQTLGKAIITLIRSPEKRQQFRDRCLQLVQNRANHQMEMEKMESFYQQIINQTKTR